MPVFSLSSAKRGPLMTGSTTGAAMAAVVSVVTAARR